MSNCGGSQPLQYCNSCNNAQGCTNFTTYSIGGKPEQVLAYQLNHLPGLNNTTDEMEFQVALEHITDDSVAPRNIGV